MLYKYEAMDKTGQEIRDEIEAPSQESAQAMIRQLGYFVTKITVATKIQPQPNRVPNHWTDTLTIWLCFGSLLVCLAIMLWTIWCSPYFLWGLGAFIIGAIIYTVVLVPRFHTMTPGIWL